MKVANGDNIIFL